MPTSRQKILAYIRKYLIASAVDISHALEMTQANARHHLAHLETEGLIEVTGQRRGRGRGRSAQVYTLSRAARGVNLEHLAIVLIEECLAGLSSSAREDALRRIARRLAMTGKNQGVNPTGSTSLTSQSTSITRSLAMTIERLNELHYQARWEASAAGPRIYLGHCPYAGIVGAHPELCQMDAFILGERLGLLVQHVAKLQQSEKGLPFCEFLVKMNTGSR